MAAAAAASIGKPAPPAAAEPPAAPFYLYSLLTFLYGMTNSFTSPALPELGEQASLSSTELGSLFLWRGVGSMIGAFLVGRVLDMTSDPHLVLSVCLAMRVCSDCFMPTGWTLPLVGVNLGCVAFSGNAIYVCGSTSISWMYGKLMGPRVSLMDAAFGVGGFFAPAVAGALAAFQLGAVQGYRVLAMADVLVLIGVWAMWDQRPRNPRFLPKQLEQPLLAGTEGADLENESLDQQTGGVTKRPAPSPSAVENSEHVVNWFAVFLCCGMILCADICFSSVIFWFYSYATQHLGLAPPLARTMNSMLWAVFGGIQFFWAWLQKPPRSVDPGSILLFLMPVCFVLALSIALPVSLAGPLLPASCMIIVALGGGMNALTTSLLRQVSFISGTAFGFIRISSACGNMLGGGSVGFLQPALGRYALPVVAASGMVLNTGWLLWMMRLRRNHDGVE
eukprot:TRINITY_DN57535_c0_g1_i1.p1 TRINITY_DN57535_c0_g1~~TRINITY_DN57535_c0_g1_i1.p1  ORF type:complete len:449 (+),score=46.72 TRINITY_DN57535_c0_g1_i1:149-1495(+)